NTVRAPAYRDERAAGQGSGPWRSARGPGQDTHAATGPRHNSPELPYQCPYRHIDSPTHGAAPGYRGQSCAPDAYRPGRSCPDKTNCSRAPDAPPGAAPHPGRVARSGGIARPAPLPSDVASGLNKRATGSTEPGNVLASHQPVGTARGPVYRPRLLPRPRIPWSPAMPAPRWLRG